VRILGVAASACSGFAGKPRCGLLLPFSIHTGSIGCPTSGSSEYAGGLRIQQTLQRAGDDWFYGHDGLYPLSRKGV
jgi:hypothetical protein